MNILTHNQARLLTVLENHPLTTLQIKNKLTDNKFDTKDSIHSSLRRMEDRQLVRRFGGRPAYWELTAFGRRTLAYHVSYGK